MNAHLIVEALKWSAESATWLFFRQAQGLGCHTSVTLWYVNAYRVISTHLYVLAHYATAKKKLNPTNIYQIWRINMSASFFRILKLKVYLESLEVGCPKQIRSYVLVAFMLSCRLLYSQKCRHILRIPCWIRKDILWVHFSGLVAYIYFNRRMHYGNGGLEYFWRCFFANAGTGGSIPFSESSSLERTAHPHQSLLSEVNNKIAMM